jgi:hypothetical protein
MRGACATASHIQNTYGSGYGCVLVSAHAVVKFSGNFKARGNFFRQVAAILQMAPNHPFLFNELLVDGVDTEEK